MHFMQEDQQLKRLSMCDLKNMRNPQAVVEVIN